ncbi:MAG TPA: DoxX family protein [Candidatus Dormibacteraeota bacterium]
MRTAYLVVTIALAGFLVLSTAADFGRYHRVLTAMSRAGVPQSWLPTLGALKGAAAVGLLVGIVVPALGIAAGAGTIVFFLGAIATHLRAHWYSFGAPATFLTLGVAALTLSLVVL